MIFAYEQWSASKADTQRRNQGRDPDAGRRHRRDIEDAGTDHFSEDDNQFLKFHGTYQQDDRDLRKTGKKSS